MKYLLNVKIKYKIILIFIFPLLGLIYFGSNEIRANWTTYNEINVIENQIFATITSSNLIHEIQKERGASAGFLGSNGEQFQAKMQKQRIQTDKSIIEFQSLFENKKIESFDPKIKNFISKANKQFSTLQKTRRTIDALQISVFDELNYFTSINSNVLNFASKLKNKLSDGKLTTNLNAYLSLLNGKERAGIERAVLSHAFAKNSFSDSMFIKFVSLLAEQNTYFNNYLNNTILEDEVNLYSQIMSSQASKSVESMRNTALHLSSQGGFEVNASDWFKNKTIQINDYKQLENKVANNILSYVDVMKSSALNRFIYGLIFFTVAIFLSIFFSIYLTMYFVSSIKELNNASIKISLGDLDQSIQTKSSDELGTLSHSFRELIRYLNEVGFAAELISEFDLSARIRKRSNKDILSSSFEKMTQNLSSIISSISTESNEVAAAAIEISATSEQMLNGSRENTNQVIDVAGAVAEMTANIQESDSNVSEVLTMAQNSADTATLGGKVVNETVSCMRSISETVKSSASSIRKLEESAHQIDTIVSVIDDIADQTNLLALNAAIEAARAGEQGRGFAVVADEVRSLADRTTKATAEISGMIKGIQTDTNTAVEAMESGLKNIEDGTELTNSASSSLDEIVKMSTSVMNMVNQLTISSKEQTTTVEQVAENIEKVAHVTKETTSGSEESARASESLSRQAENLQLIVSKFKYCVGEECIIELARKDHQFYMQNLDSGISSKEMAAMWHPVDHFNCRFGKWYHSDKTLEFREDKTFKDISDIHQSVHQNANIAIEKALQNKLREAKQYRNKCFENSKKLMSLLDILEKNMKMLPNS